MWAELVRAWNSAQGVDGKIVASRDHQFGSVRIAVTVEGEELTEGDVVTTYSRT